MTVIFYYINIAARNICKQIFLRVSFCFICVNYNNDNKNNNSVKSEIRELESFSKIEFKPFPVF